MKRLKRSRSKNHMNERPKLGSALSALNVSFWVSPAAIIARQMTCTGSGGWAGYSPSDECAPTHP